MANYSDSLHYVFRMLYKVTTGLSTYDFESSTPLYKRLTAFMLTHSTNGRFEGLEHIAFEHAATFVNSEDQIVRYFLEFADPSDVNQVLESMMLQCGFSSIPRTRSNPLPYLNFFKMVFTKNRSRKDDSTYNHSLLIHLAKGTPFENSSPTFDESKDPISLIMALFLQKRLDFFDIPTAFKLKYPQFVVLHLKKYKSWSHQFPPLVESLFQETYPELMKKAVKYSPQIYMNLADSLRNDIGITTLALQGMSRDSTLILHYIPTFVLIQLRSLIAEIVEQVPHSIFKLDKYFVERVPNIINSVVRGFLKSTANDLSFHRFLNEFKIFLITKRPDILMLIIEHRPMWLEKIVSLYDLNIDHHQAVIKELCRIALEKEPDTIQFIPETILLKNPEMLQYSLGKVSNPDILLKLPDAIIRLIQKELD